MLLNKNKNKIEYNQMKNKDKKEVANKNRGDASVV